MKILLITHFFPPSRNAGTENYTQGISKALLARGHEVQVLCVEDWNSGDFYWNGVFRDNYQSVMVNRVHLNWKKAANPNLVLYQSKEVNQWLFTFLAEEEFDVVHITSAITLGAGILPQIQQAGIPVVLTLMDFWFLCPSVQLLRSDGTLCDGRTTPLECQACLMASSGLAHRLGQEGNLGFFYNKFWGALAGIPSISKIRGFRGKLLHMSDRKQTLISALRIPDVIITHSEFVRDVFSYHIDTPIRLLRNGHDLSWLERFSTKTKYDKVRFGYVGQIIPIKGVHLLVEAFKYQSIAGKAELNIWGDLTKDTPYVETLKMLIGDDPSISLCGHFDHDKLGNILSGIDVLVVPSIWYENAPLVIQEAFATNTPVIATDLGGMAEAVNDRVDGLLFEHASSVDLGEKLKLFFDNPDLLAKLIEGIPAVKQVEQEVVELEEIYSKLIISDNL